MKILFVLTSHDALGETGEKTGFWLEEFASPYYKLKDNGVEVVLSSPKGGQPPLDPKSNTSDFQTDATRRFEQDKIAQQSLAQTVKLSDIKIDDFDGVFYPGGHGPLWDLTQDEHSIALIEKSFAQNKPVAAVCHAPAVFLQVKTKEGEPLLKGKRATGFSNEEEEAVGLTDVVPFLIEEQFKALGAIYEKTESWHPFTIVDGLMITGQNPASSESVAEALYHKLVSVY